MKYVISLEDDIEGPEGTCVHYIYPTAAAATKRAKELADSAGVEARVFKLTETHLYKPKTHRPAK